MNVRLFVLCTVVMLVLAALSAGVFADEENRLFLPAVSGGVENAATWTPTTESLPPVEPTPCQSDCGDGGATATPTPTPGDVVIPPDDLIDCSNPDFASLPQCSGGTIPGTIPPTATPTPGGVVIPPDDLIDCSNPEFAGLPECN